MKKLPELSFFFPFWNEDKNIELVVNNAIPVVSKVADKWEILMIDDGSSDNTLKIAEKLAKNNKNLKVISHKPNRGYGAALKDGFYNTQYKYIAFCDGDGQFDLSEIYKFIDKIKDADIVIGYRNRRKDTLGRHMLMNMLKLWDYIFFGFHFRDIDCGFKMFKKEAIENLIPLRSEGAMITTEILAKATRKELNIKEVEVTHYPRKFGDQSGGNLPVVIRAILESFILWWDLKNKRF